MSDGVPKSRVTLVYDTKQPEGREKPRELPFRLLVLGDVGGDKGAALDQRKVRQLNGRNLGEVMKGLKIEVKDIPLDGDGKRKTRVVVDSMTSFSPDDILRLLTGQKAAGANLDPVLAGAWGTQATAQTLWRGDEQLMQHWAEREKVAGFQKSYQNSKTLRAALKSFSSPPANDEEKTARQRAISDMKAAIAKTLAPAAAPPSPPVPPPTPTTPTTPTT